MELISRNLPVKTENVEEAHIERFDLRREPKVRGLIRVVSLGDYDSVACGGLHTAGTGEVKLLKHTYTEKIRGNIRLHWKIGDRALRDYAMKHGIVSSLVELFSAQAPDLLERVRAFQEELAETRRRTHFIEGRLAGELAHRLYEEALRSRRISKPPSGGDAEPLIITGDFEGEGKDFLKKVSEGIPGEAAWLFAGINRLGDSFQWLIAVSDPKLFDFHRAKDSILSAIDGKGGGRPPLWQGVGSRVDGIPRFFEHLQSGSNPGSG
jgi:alanyl-tRNA synthetase